MISKIKQLLEDINVKGLPTRDSLDKSLVGLYRKAYTDYRDKRNLTTKSYLQGIQDALIISLGTHRFDTVKRRIKQDYAKNKIV